MSTLIYIYWVLVHDLKLKWLSGFKEKKYALGFAKNLIAKSNDKKKYGIFYGTYTERDEYIKRVNSNVIKSLP